MHQTKHILLTISILTMLSMTLAACAAGNDLAGTQWRLTELNGRAPLASVEPITLSFTSADQAGGNSGCNSYGGSYRVASSSLTFGALASTKRACADQGMMTQEATFLQALGAVTSYDLSDGQLALQDSAGAVVLRFAQV